MIMLILIAGVVLKIFGAEMGSGIVGSLLVLQLLSLCILNLSQENFDRVTQLADNKSNLYAGCLSLFLAFRLYT